MPDATAEVQSTGSPVAALNPIAWGQFHLRGGWKSFWPTTLGYAGVVGAGILLVVRMSDATPGALYGLKTAFIGLQAGLIIIFVSTRVGTAIRQDQTTRMIESHRLTPMSPSQAVLGYLVGPSVQPLALCAANFLLGCGLCRVTGTPLALWFTLNAILLGFSAFATTVAAFGSFAGRPGAAAVGWIASLVGMVNFVTIGWILPGVNVLATPLVGSSIFNLGVAGAEAVSVYAPSTVFQVMIAGVCFAGACRRYRRDDRPALGWDLGLALLAAWVATSAYGIVSWEEVRPSVTRGQVVDPSSQYLGSTVAAMLLALVPLAGSAWLSADWEGRRALTDPAAGPQPPAPPVVVLAATALTLALVVPLQVRLRDGASVPLDAALRTGAVLLAFYGATGYFIRVLVRVTNKLLFPLLAWTMCSWFIPMTVDYVRWWIAGAVPDESMLRTASAFGALGALIQVWADGGVTTPVTNPGIAFQLVLAAGMAAAYYVTRPGWERQPVASQE